MAKQVDTGGMAREMTLRDHFADSAMRTLLSRGWVGTDATEEPAPYCEHCTGDNDPDIGTLAQDAYRVADAMLAVRAGIQAAAPLLLAACEAHAAHLVTTFPPYAPGESPMD